MQIEHNSRGIFYRNPYGAVTCNSEIIIRLAVSGVGIPHSVQLICNADNEEYSQILNMDFEFTISDNSIYKATLKAPQNACLLWYYFKLETDNGAIYYGNNKRQMGGIGEIFEDIPDNAYQITVYNKDYKTPDWFKKSVAYQIFPDRFYNGNENEEFLGNRTDIIKRDWNDIPYYKAEQFGGEYLANDFFGGNLLGIRKKLLYLKELGIGVIYLNPIFKAYSNHKYDTGNYEEIDPMFGTEQDFKGLCKEADKLGIKIILDGVFNHTGSDSKYFNKNNNYDSIGAYQSEESPYYSWFRFSKWPEEYESWWGMQTLPQCEENSEEYRKYILSDKDSIIKKWLRNGASGWRLDVVDELPGFFVKELRENAKSEKDDCVIIGEVWEDASNKSAYGERREYFLGKELDSVMNYPMRNALINFMLGNYDAQTLDEQLMSLKENYPKEAYYSLLNILSSHDVERVFTLMGNALSRHDVDKDYQAQFTLNQDAYNLAMERTKTIIAMQMLMPGVPCIYYGDEIAMQGYGDPFCRCTFKWDSINKNPMLEWVKNIVSLRNSSEALSTGEFESVYKIGSIYAFLRYDEKEKYLVIVNSGYSDKIRLDVARFGIHKLKNIYCDEIHSDEKGIFFIEVQCNGIKIFVAE